MTMKPLRKVPSVSGHPVLLDDKWLFVKVCDQRPPGRGVHRVLEMKPSHLIGQRDLVSFPTLFGRVFGDVGHLQVDVVQIQLFFWRWVGVPLPNATAKHFAI